MKRLIVGAGKGLESGVQSRGAWVTRRLVTLARVYFTWLFIWAALRFGSKLVDGDRWWWLFLWSSFAAYLFVPLPAILGIALLSRRREVWIGFGLALALGAYLYGGLFLPVGWRHAVAGAGSGDPCRANASDPPQANAGQKSPLETAADRTLTVMSYNVLGFNEHPEGVLAAIRASGADVIAFQELNPAVAEAIQGTLSDLYPYQALDARRGVSGSGVISRYPLHPTGEILAGEGWVGTPQVLIMDWQGEHVTLLNLHAVPTTLAVTTNSAGLSRKLVDGLRSMAARVEASVSLSTRERERQAQVIVDYVISHPGPTIVLADLNAGDQSDAYARLVGRAGGSVVDKLMVDSWREAGWGMGHTFPGAASTGSSRPTIGGVPIVPKWLVRIDYVFHSRHWCALSARIGPWDGISDHRPVWVRLVLRET